MSKVIKPQTRRNRKPTRLPYGTHVIYAEGTKTEPKYVDNIKCRVQKNQKEREGTINIEIVDESGGRSPAGLLRYAINDVNTKRQQYKIDHVWIFYDKDSFNVDEFDNTYSSILAKNVLKNEGEDSTDEFGTCWHACWSNECFELWVLLHFNFEKSALPRTEYIPKIDKYLKPFGYRYQKNLDNLYDILEECGSVKDAISNARKLDAALQNPKKKINPSTGVYLFVERFTQFL